MNIAFGTILLFLIFVPGVVARRAYLTYPFSKEFTGFRALDEFVFGLVPGALLQVVGILLVEGLSPYTIDFASLGYLLSGGTQRQVGEAFELLHASLAPLFLYNAVLWLLAAVVGFALKHVVIHFKLDVRFPFLRYGNQWYYLLTGRIVEFPEFEHVRATREQIDLTLVDVLVNTGKEDVLYSGILDDFRLGPRGGLSSLLLRHVVRRRLADDDGEARYELPGTFFLVEQARIVNINIDYLEIETADTESDA